MSIYRQNKRFIWAYVIRILPYLFFFPFFFHSQVHPIGCGNARRATMSGYNSANHSSATHVPLTEPDTSLKSLLPISNLTENDKINAQLPHPMIANKPVFLPVDMDKAHLIKMWMRMNQTSTDHSNELSGAPTESINPPITSLDKTIFNPTASMTGALGLDKTSWLDKVDPIPLPPFPPLGAFLPLSNPSALTTMEPMFSFSFPNVSASSTLPTSVTERYSLNPLEHKCVCDHRTISPLFRCETPSCSERGNGNNSTWSNLTDSSSCTKQRHSAPAGPDLSDLLKHDETNKRWCHTVSRLNNELTSMLTKMMLMSQSSTFSCPPPPPPPPPFWSFNSTKSKLTCPTEPLENLQQPLDLSYSGIPNKRENKNSACQELGSFGRFRFGSWAGENRWGTSEASQSNAKESLILPRSRLSDPGVFMAGSLFPPFGSALKRKRSRPTRIGVRCLKQASEIMFIFTSSWLDNDLNTKKNSLFSWLFLIHANQWSWEIISYLNLRSPSSYSVTKWYTYFQQLSEDSVRLTIPLVYELLIFHF